MLRSGRGHVGFGLARYTFFTMAGPIQGSGSVGGTAFAAATVEAPSERPNRRRVKEKELSGMITSGKRISGELYTDFGGNTLKPDGGQGTLLACILPLRRV